MTEPRTVTVQKLLESIGLPRDFLDQLLKESDWSLVIKMHAVFEAVLASLITKRLANPQVGDVVSNLDFNNTKAGKVALARALGLVESPEVAFLRGLSELRNKLVHNIENVTFSFKTHVASLSAAELKKFRTEFGFAIRRLENGDAEYDKYLRTHPRLIVYLAAYDCLLNLQFRVSNQARNMLAEVLLERSAR